MYDFCCLLSKVNVKSKLRLFTFFIRIPGHILYHDIEMMFVIRIIIYYKNKICFMLTLRARNSTVHVNGFVY